MTYPQQTPPGWYPEAGGGMRWWDGAQWTANTLPSAGGVAPTAVTYPPVPEGTPVYTRWIWWIVVLPVIVFVPTVGYLIDLQVRMIDLIRWMVSAVGPDGSMDPSLLSEVVSREMAMIFTPWYFAMLAVGLAAIVLTVVFSYFDHRDLLRLGYARPFHWAWSFFALAGYGIVYVIGRSVVVRRRSGRGLAPMWVSIAVIGASFVFSMAWAWWFTATLMQQFVEIVGTFPS